MKCSQLIVRHAHVSLSLAAPQIAPMEDFPLEQSQDETLHHAFNQVMKTDGCQVHPDTALTHQYFDVIRDRLYRASCEARTEEELTQLLVLKSRQERIFQTAHHNPMAGHLGYDESLNWIMARFYWPDIWADVTATAVLFVFLFVFMFSPFSVRS